MDNFWSKFDQKSSQSMAGYVDRLIDTSHEAVVEVGEQVHLGYQLCVSKRFIRLHNGAG